jgi:creatinine amidohydrolase
METAGPPCHRPPAIATAARLRLWLRGREHIGGNAVARKQERVMEIEWRKLRADELRERARRDAMVIVPVGSLEQHGPHLPVEVDSVLGEATARRTAELIARTEPVPVLPMLWTGVSEHHMSFGGTITLDLEAFYATIRCICQSLVRHGFRRIVLETQKALLHACEAETSMMMALRPELVAEDRIPLAKTNTTPDITDLVGGGVYRWRTLGAISSSGVWGHPEAASAAKGEQLLAAIAEQIAAKLTNKELWALPYLSDKVQP